MLDATEQAVYKDKEDEAMQAAQQAAADTQAMRQLEDRCEALQEQLESTANSLHSSETQLRWGQSLGLDFYFGVIDELALIFAPLCYLHAEIHKGSGGNPTI